MNKENVYIAVYTNYNESIFYKISNDMYYDLRTKEAVYSTNLISIIPYNEVIPTNIKTPVGIVSLYNLDRIKLINLKNTFIGDISEVIGTETVNKENGHFYLKNVTKAVKSHALLYIYDHNKCRDLEDNKIYNINHICNIGSYSVDIYGDINSYIEWPQSSYMSKAKLLEQYRKFINTVDKNKII